jgi:hypothetical protein
MKFLKVITFWGVVLSAIAALSAPFVFHFSNFIFLKNVENLFLLRVVHTIEFLFVCVLFFLVSKFSFKITTESYINCIKSFPFSKRVNFFAVFLVFFLSACCLISYFTQDIDVSDDSIFFYFEIFVSAISEEFLFRLLMCTFLYYLSGSVFFTIIISSVNFYISHLFSYLFFYFLNKPGVSFFDIFNMISFNNLSWFIFSCIISFIWVKTRSFRLICTIHFLANMFIYM